MDNEQLKVHSKAKLSTTKNWITFKSVVPLNLVFKLSIINSTFSTAFNVSPGAIIINWELIMGNGQLKINSKSKLNTTKN